MSFTYNKSHESHHEEGVVLPVFVQEQRGPVLLVLEGVADVLGILKEPKQLSAIILNND